MKTNIDTAINALADHLGISPEEITEERYEHYGMPVYSAGGEEYAVGTDSEADDAAQSYVADTLWAFNASFILGECELPLELESAIQAMQEKECESCNDTIRAMIDKCTSIESFTEAAIRDDGRGHFLSSYDGEEIELAGGFYAYRVN